MMEEERNNVRFVEWLLSKIQISVVKGDYKTAVLDLMLAEKKVRALRIRKQKAAREADGG